MKLLIIGHGRHGKDTVAEILHNKYGMKYDSSSNFACKKFIYEKMKEYYSSIDECYDDRHNKRSMWYDLICDYNMEDKSKLAKELLKENDIYVGMRSIDEFMCCMENKLFDKVIWVDASNRINYKEDTTSNTLTSDCADIILDNNGTLEALEASIGELINSFVVGGYIV